MLHTPKQKGAVLLVSLILLLVLTSAGVSAISMALLERRLASNNHDLQIAFESAESALIAAESDLLQHTVNQKHWLNSCQKKDCFTANCQYGLCRTFSYDKNGNCTPGPERPWITASTWLDNRYHRRIELFSSPQKTARLIIEFRCFLNNGTNPTQIPQKQPYHNEQSGKTALYRITVLANGGTETAQVMLQSVLELPTANNTSAGTETHTAPIDTPPEKLFEIRAKQRRSWQQLDIPF